MAKSKEELAAEDAAKEAAKAAPKVAAKPPVARVCKQDERAEPGLKRFKLRVTNYGTRGYRYVLAPDEAAARALHIEVEGLGNPPDGAEKPQLVVTELPD